jgi:hypothetical protein
MAFGLVPGIIQNYYVASGSSYTRLITVNHLLCGDTDSENFPVLVSLSHSTLKTQAYGGHVKYSSGNDIIFSEDQALTIPLSWEISSYDEVNGVLIAWVKLPTVSSTGNTVFYMNYGDTDNSTFAGDVMDTFSNSFNRVFHLNNSFTDVFGYVGSNVNISFVPGKIGQAAEFVASNFSTITSDDTDLPSGGTARTMSTWINMSEPPNEFNTAIGYGTSGIYGKAYIMGPYDYTNSFAFSQWGAEIHTANYEPVVDTWYHVTVISDGDNANIYLNGETIYPSNINLGINTLLNGSLIFGGFSETGYFNGLLNEVRISNVVRDIDWIKKEYNNQNTPGNIGTSGFLSFGGEIVNI